MQDAKAHRVVQLPRLRNRHLCPYVALQALLKSRKHPPHSPLFAKQHYSFHPIIDTHIRDALKMVLSHLGIQHRGHGFHSFRRSGATLAFDNYVSLQHIMLHGNWRSSSVWTYLQNASVAPSVVPLAFSSIIPS